MKEIAERIKETRIQKGLTQEQLANRLGWTRSAISKIEHDTYEISLETAKKIARALDADPGYIIFGAEDVKGEINRLFDRLTPDQQKSVLDFLRTMLGDRAKA